jgi:hypothetical protein
MEPTPGNAEPELDTDLELLPVLQALLVREPLFHRRELVGGRSDFERETDPGFWEVGASGRRYSREFVWSTLVARYAADPVDTYTRDRWRITDEQVRQVAADVFLLTYTLISGDAVTRRVTLWRGGLTSGWQALFHQGTIVSSD